MKKYLIFAIIVSSFVYTQTTTAQEPIMITRSDNMNEVIFDGKWTNTLEWKHSSLNEITFEKNKTIYLRTAHQENFIYVHLNVEFDKTLDKGLDRATVCIDKENNKSQIADTGDYCFIVALDREHGTVLQGGSMLGRTGNFENINTPEEFIAVATVSDENDRYSITPHTSYEFRIPTDLVGRSNNYGFYFTVYDATEKRFYSWPDTNPTTPHSIPSPSMWGELISPDNSLPEFSWPLFATVVGFVSLLYYSRIMNKGLLS